MNLQRGKIITAIHRAHATVWVFYMSLYIPFIEALIANKCQSQDTIPGLPHDASAFHHFSVPPVIPRLHSETDFPLATLSEMKHSIFETFYLFYYLTFYFLSAYSRLTLL